VTKQVAYVTSAFPYLPETFILREICELEARGWDLTVFALKPPPIPGTHANARRWAPRTLLFAPLGAASLRATLWYLLRSPRMLLGLWLKALWWNRGSLNFLVRVPAILLQAAAMARVMQRRGIRHIHAHFASHPALAALAAATLAGTSYSVTVHAHDIFMRHTGLRPKMLQATFLACISDFNRQYLRQLIPDLRPESLLLVRCGVDPKRFRPADASGSPRSPFRLVCVASLQEYKGVQVLVEALARLARDGVAFECLLICTGPLRPSLEARVRELGLVDRVSFLGAQPEERVAELVRGAAVFVAPSVLTNSGQMDGIPVALMEAMASGVPVVASRLSGIPELVIDGVTGVLVPPGDVGALAAAIQRLAREPAMAQQLAEQGRQHVLREFNLEANTALLASLFELVIADHPLHTDPATPEPSQRAEATA
jgi:colanic acid/amylovoran biosynthesis glycosyltransferase